MQKYGTLKLGIKVMMSSLTGKGFTLVEVLIAMAIFSIGILAMYAMQGAAIKGNGEAGQITVAVQVMSDQIERIAGSSYSDPILSVGNHTSTLSLPIGINQCTWNVTEWSSDGVDNDNDSVVDEIDESNIKQVNITVSYNDRGANRLISVPFIKLNQ